MSVTANYKWESTHRGPGMPSPRTTFDYCIRDLLTPPRFDQAFICRACAHSCCLHALPPSHSGLDYGSHGASVRRWSQEFFQYRVKLWRLFFSFYSALHSKYLHIRAYVRAGRRISIEYRHKLPVWLNMWASRSAWNLSLALKTQQVFCVSPLQLFQLLACEGQDARQQQQMLRAVCPGAFSCLFRPASQI